MTQLHHFEITTSSLERRVAQFQAQFGFSVFAHKDEKEKAAVALRCHSIVVVVKECSELSPIPHDDWISDVAMKVSNINCSREQAIKASASFVSLKGCLGKDEKQESFTIHSPFSNVRHTMLADCDGECVQEPTFTDSFNCPSQLPLTMETNFACLPGFVKCPQTQGRVCDTCSARFPRQQHKSPQTSHVDHVTFACRMGTSEALLDWYERCLGFRRFLLGDNENKQGLISYGNNGMRMLATQYWQCSESGVRAPMTSTQTGQKPVQLVFAEPLPGTGINQVQVFLDQNGCAGVQHIAFHCDNIVSSVSQLRQNGVQFISPPPEYYSMMEKVAEIGQAGEKLELLRANNVLIDTEVEEDEETGQSFGKHEGQNTRYLMQVFSQPVFERDTFFIELIRRCGAKGFGSGNIAALWKALDIHFKQNMLCR